MIAPAQQSPETPTRPDYVIPESGDAVTVLGEWMERRRQQRAPQWRPAPSQPPEREP